MKKLYYPAKFIQEKEGYSVFFLDFENVFTCGKTLQEAYEFAQDRLFIELTENNNLKKPDLKHLKKQTEENEFIILVELDIEEYSKKSIY